jgi:uncharacterized protein YndB with AHSA1/START domain
MHRGATLVWLVGAALVPLAQGEDLMAGKVQTDHTIRLEKTVDLPPDRAFEMWATEAGVRSFYAPAAHIDPRVGGRYEILFAPDKDPQGLSHGTTGARILKYEPGRSLWFEWIAFAADANLGAKCAARRTPGGAGRKAAADLGGDRLPPRGRPSRSHPRQLCALRLPDGRSLGGILRVVQQGLGGRTGGYGGGATLARCVLNPAPSSLLLI